MCPISDGSRGKDRVLTKFSREISGEEALLPSMEEIFLKDIFSLHKPSNISSFLKSINNLVFVTRSVTYLELLRILMNIRRTIWKMVAE
jgi:hypothetical protein